MPKPVVNADDCTGCGLCEQIASNTFVVNDDGIAEVVNAEGDDTSAIQEAIDSCPQEAIAWEE
jgi:ferredoxin